MKPNAELYNAILKGDRDSARQLVQQAVDRNDNVVELLNSSMIPPLRELGNLYSEKKVLLPDLLVGARAMRAGLDIIEPMLAKQNHRKGVKVCIGTVKGDGHDIGKSIVAMIARAAGYEVDDLGSNCDVDAFAKSVESGSRAVLCSLMLTTCLPYLKTILKHFKGHHGVQTIVGGSVMTRELAVELGADAYGADATETVSILDGFFG
jgi:5-methyltetrahydrofolate--homocysteine methyltransferase